MSDNNTYTREGSALQETESTTDSTSMTIADYLYSLVNFDIPSEVVVRILLERDVDKDTEAMDVPKATRDLCKADLYVWIVMGVSRRGTVSDTDNGWTHSDGGYTLSEQDKKYFLSAANSIYAANDEDEIGKTTMKVTSFGIKPARFDSAFAPIPRID